MRTTEWPPRGYCGATTTKEQARAKMYLKMFHQRNHQTQTIRSSPWRRSWLMMQKLRTHHPPRMTKMKMKMNQWKKQQNQTQDNHPKKHPNDPKTRMNPMNQPHRNPKHAQHAKHENDERKEQQVQKQSTPWMPERTPSEWELIAPGPPPPEQTTGEPRTPPNPNRKRNPNPNPKGGRAPSSCRGLPGRGHPDEHSPERLLGTRLFW